MTYGVTVGAEQLPYCNPVIVEFLAKIVFGKDPKGDRIPYELFPDAEDPTDDEAEPESDEELAQMKPRKKVTIAMVAFAAAYVRTSLPSRVLRLDTVLADRAFPQGVARW